MVQNLTRVKVVWTELDRLHSIIATPLGEENGFLKLRLVNGNSILLSRSAIIKVEEVGQ